MKIQDDTFLYENKGVQCLKKVVRNDLKHCELLRDRLYKKIILPKDYIYLEYYTSSWGQEFMKQEMQVKTNFIFENTKGRCGAQSNPFFTIKSKTQKIDIAIATSTNYRVELKNEIDHIEVLISDVNEAFSIRLNPEEEYLYPYIYIHRYSGLKQGYEEKQLYMKRFYEEHQLHNEMPIVYNHWWAYEDYHINEEVILQNAKIGKELGIEMLVLDAGWFGNDQSDEHWFTIRGDWNKENRQRFPHGVSYLSKKIKEMGLKFGIWCEFEGLGVNAQILKDCPHFQAKRGKEPLNYACFGSQEVQAWAIETMSSLIECYQADYWKLDFNLDPGIGCDEISHGHGRGNGLQAHEQGVYHVLQVLRKRYPHLVIENCSSGGQRINLQMAAYTDVHFMSDPDYSSHQLRLFVELSKWFLPKQLLHFMWSNTVMKEGSSPFENLDINTCSKKELQYHMRLAFLHHMGISRRLPQHLPKTLAIMKDEITMYKECIRVFVKDGDYYPLLLDEHLQVFQFLYKEEALLFVFTQKKGHYEICLEQSDAEVIDIDTLQKERIHGNTLQVDMEENLQCRLFIIKK